MMYKSFQQYTQENLKLKKSDKLLLAISGGADSVAMLSLFSKTDYSCGIAHCNFHLRGKESDKDEQLVKKIAKEYNYPIFTIDFNTNKYAKENGISIEMAARKLRYNWFEKIRQENNYDYIATAHHKDDVIETFFINLARGTGIRGLSGIKAVAGNIIRPILFADQVQISNYVNKNLLEFREDASNTDVKFKRNKLRHDIIPELAEINSAYKQNIIKTIERLNVTNQLLQEKMAEIKVAIVEEKNEQLFFDISKLKKLEPLNFYLFELLYPYGFNSNQLESIIESFDGISGKIFYSPTHKLTKDREYLILTLNSDYHKLTAIIEENDDTLRLIGESYLQIKTVTRTENFKIPKQLNIAVLDKNKLQFPLEIRNWQKGDYFYPIGMKKKKKLSDFFIDIKLSTIEKGKIPLLTSQGEIVWIIGHRLDNRFKITDSTKNVLHILYKK